MIGNVLGGPQIVRAYHGTTDEAAEQIRSEGKFRQSEKKWDWLGFGAYFFQDAPHRALEWAKKYSVPHYGGKPSVVAVQIDLEGCLDLLDVRAPDFLVEYDKIFRRGAHSEVFQEALKIIDGKIISERKIAGLNVRDCLFLNSACRYLRRRMSLKVSSVRAVFIEGEAITKTSHLFTRNHVQISVRDLKRINMETAIVLDEDTLRRA